MFDRLPLLVTSLIQILSLNLPSFNLLFFLEQDWTNLRFNDLFIIINLFPGGFLSVISRTSLVPVKDFPIAFGFSVQY